MADYDANVVAADSDIDRLIVDLISSGATNTEIAKRLHYSLPSVKLRIRRLMRSFGARNRVALAARASHLDTYAGQLRADGLTDAEIVFLSQFFQLPPSVRAIVAEVGLALSESLPKKNGE
jgi:hypothetical protein